MGDSLYLHVFLRPQEAILNYILSSWCLPVGWWDCFLRALKAHKETSTHDYQGWLQARPIREDIKKYFYLLINWMNESIKPKGSEYDKVFWSYFSLPSCLLCDSLVIPMQVPFSSHSKERTWNGPGTDLQRTYNGSTTEAQRTYNGGTYLTWFRWLALAWWASANNCP